jgi:predicted flap endonuclease-1-like 5' DNA nuclease
MSNSQIPSQYYNNTSFSPEENTSLKSSILGFGETLSISINLLKKRLSNLFLPVLVWQLVLFILFLITQGLLIFGIARSFPQGSPIYIPSPIDPSTYEVSKEFIDAATNILTVPAVIGFTLLMLLVLVVYALISTWIEYKSRILINDTSAKLFDSNSFFKKFWVLILFSICYSVITGAISNIFDIEGSAAVNFVIGVLSFISMLVFMYAGVVVEYITSNYLIEKNAFWDSFRTMINAVKKFWLSDFFRHLIFMLIISLIAIFGIFLFAGLGFGLLFPLASSNELAGSTGIVLLVLFALLLFLAIIFVLALTWLVQAFSYVAYYNIRMLDLHNVTNTDSHNYTPKVIEGGETSQTLEEKLMQNNGVEQEVDEHSPLQNQPQSNIETEQAVAFVGNQTLSEQKSETAQEYDLMDVQSSSQEPFETKPEPTIINPSQASIIGLANIKKSNFTDYTEDETAVTESPSFPPIESDNLQIIEGIGPKIEELLHNDGIKTFTQLADTSLEDLKAILEEAGNQFSIHDPLNWPREAVLARDGKLEELEALKEELVRGV